MDSGACVDSAWEQYKLEASLPKVATVQGKLLDCPAGVDSHTFCCEVPGVLPSAHCVRPCESPCRIGPIPLVVELVDARRYASWSVRKHVQDDNRQNQARSQYRCNDN